MNCSGANITLEDLQTCLVSQANTIQLLETRLEVQENIANVSDKHVEFLTHCIRLLGTIGIFMMQIGFACLESGIVRAKNTRSVLFKNMLDMGVTVCIWYFWGYALSNNDWASMLNFKIGDPLDFMYSASFACTTVTIVSGGIVERMRFEVYALFSTFMAGFIYPIIVGLCWAADGAFVKEGFMDFAGSGVVHMTGGFAGLAGAIILGPRLNRFDSSGKPEDALFAARSPRVMVLGAFLLFLGWIPFNAISPAALHAHDSSIIFMCAANTLISAAAASLSFIVLQKLLRRPHDLRVLVDCFLSGLVAITASSGLVQPYHALLIGFVATLLTLFGNRALFILKIDDPLGVSVVHGLNGIWGILAAGLFVQHAQARDLTSSLASSRGLFDEEEPGSWGFLGVEVWVCLFIGFFSFLAAFIFFMLFGLTPLGVKVDKDTEALGLDMRYHDHFDFSGASKGQIKEQRLKREAKSRVQIQQMVDEKMDEVDMRRDPSQRRQSNYLPGGHSNSEGDLSFTPFQGFPSLLRDKREIEQSSDGGSVGSIDDPALWGETDASPQLSASRHGREGGIEMDHLSESPSLFETINEEGSRRQSLEYPYGVGDTFLDKSKIAPSDTTDL